eukprot:6207085-Pleurochrysis_carterae.AAC.2
MALRDAHDLGSLKAARWREDAVALRARQHARQWRVERLSIIVNDGDRLLLHLDNSPFDGAPVTSEGSKSGWARSWHAKYIEVDPRMNVRKARERKDDMSFLRCKKAMSPCCCFMRGPSWPRILREAAACLLAS